MKKGVNIFQWNVLAQSLTDGFPHTPKEHLTLEHRLELHLKELRRAAANNAIIVLEEVDIELLTPFVTALDGYLWRWVSKNSEDKGFRDGTLIMWPKKLFTVVRVETVELGTQNAVVAEFTDFMLCAVHLKAKPGFYEKRTEQVAAFLRHIWLKAAIIVGDFNDVPESDCIQLLRDAGYKSAYADHPPTTAKRREEAVVRCIDYIWVRGGEVVETSKLRDLEDYAPNYLPCETWPSDHLALEATIKFKN